MTDRSQGNYILLCICTEGCPCRFKKNYTHLNLVRNDIKKSSIVSLSEIRWINIRGRGEHEIILKDIAWCKELGLDQTYEVTAYLKRWGSWLSN